MDSCQREIPKHVKISALRHFASKLKKKTYIVDFTGRKSPSTYTQASLLLLGNSLDWYFYFYSQYFLKKMKAPLVKYNSSIIFPSLLLMLHHYKSINTARECHSRSPQLPVIRRSTATTQHDKPCSLVRTVDISLSSVSLNDTNQSQVSVNSCIRKGALCITSKMSAALWCCKNSC